MSVLALDLEQGLTGYAPIPGEENAHNCGRWIRILRILKTLKQQETFQSQQQQQPSHLADIRYQFPTNEEKNKIIRMGLKSCKENLHINGYKAIWVSHYTKHDYD